MKTFNELTGLYSLSKTLRFELKPVGKTLANIEAKGVITKDKQRAEEYEKVKDIIDRYHKSFIDMCLSNLTLNTVSEGKNDSLEDYVALASKASRDEKDEKEFDHVKKSLREQIVEAFKKGNSYGELFKKELILNHLPNFVTDDQEKQMVENFSKFTTYFTGFYENRKNMYSDEEKSTAIAYRLIHENLPIFIDNIKSFAKIAQQEDVDFIANIEHIFKEELKGHALTDLFTLEYFSSALTQSQIELYNTIVGSRVENNGVKKQGLNECINLYNQQHKDSRLPLLKPLYKMILSDRIGLPWLSEEFATDEEMLNTISDTHNNLKPVLDEIRELLINIGNFDIEHIYIANDKGITDISQQLFGQYNVYTSAIKAKIRSKITPSAKERKDSELLDKRINNIFKANKSFSIARLNSYVDSEKTIQEYFSQLGAYDRNSEQRINLLMQIELAYSDALAILSSKATNLNQSEDSIKKIKALLDAYKALQHFIKPLLGNGDEADKDNEFDAKLRGAWVELDVITHLYDKVRNRLTRKPYSTEKIKLNFENAQLLNGWVDSKTEKSDNGTQYGGYLFRKLNEIGEYDYYLGISADKKLFRRNDSIIYKDGMFERLDYYQVKGQTIFGSSYAGSYENDSKNILEAFQKAIVAMHFPNAYIPLHEEKVVSYLKRIKKIKGNGYHLLMNNPIVQIQYKIMKENILKTLSSLKRVSHAIQLSKRKDLDIDELMDEINSMPSKSFTYFPISNDSIKLANERDNAPLFLFKITNKDLSYAETATHGLRQKRGIENLHTMYFKALMSMAQRIFDIGIGTVFFRSKTKGLEKSTARHAAKRPIEKRNNLNKETSIFPYEIIKDKRYTYDKFLFHLSIEINYDKPNKYNLNKDVCNIIRNNGIEHIIGIDRGERHLLYLSLIDMKGNILQQMSLNDIINEYQGNKYITNYKDLLQAREVNRKEARQNWQKIENIKELKEGYLSQVIHIITKMMVEYKAIVVLEDLNMGFMRGRQKIERQVYEKFEKMLIDKLNFLVNKKKDANELGGVLHAYQLASKFDTFKKLGKQSGCLFYIPAWNTSKIDPVTGFVNMLDTRYENPGKAQCFFSKFKSIRYNADKNWFEFHIDDYCKFTDKAKGTQCEWVLCTYGTRIQTFSNDEKLNQWNNKEIVLTDEFKKILNEAGIDIYGNLKESICGLTERKYLEPLMHLMKLLVQMRNSETNSEVDYMLSPVADEQGNFYDSRTCGNNLPENADANGAYNIARKGLWAVMKIKASAPGESMKLGISNNEWLQFAQKKPYLND